MLDRFAEPLSDPAGVVEPRFLARHAEANRGAGPEVCLPRYRTRQTLELMKCLRPKGRDPDQYPARDSQPTIRARDHLERGAKTNAADFLVRSGTERGQLARNERLESRSGRGERVERRGSATSRRRSAPER